MYGVVSHLRSASVARGAIVPVWLLLALLLLVAAQLVPLPHAWWSSLPGRELAVQVAEALQPGLSYPLSLDPERTRLFAAGLMVPAAFFVATTAAGRDCQLWAVRVIVAAATLSALLGAIQLASGQSTTFRLYEEGLPGVASGLFVNRNHQASLLLAGMIACAALIRLDGGRIRVPGRPALSMHYGWALLPLFALMTIATGSRAGAALLLLFLPIAVLVALGRAVPTLILASLALVLLVVGALLAFGQPELFDTLVARFGQLQDMRRELLPDLLFTLGQYWPAGSGFGTFDPVFRANENLDLMTSAYVNHAHNEYIELAIEAGLAGVLLAVAALAWLGARTIVLFRRPPGGGSRVLPLAGVLIILLFLLHSLVDYPLRIDGLAALFGVAAALVSNPAVSDRSRRSRRASARSKPRFRP